MASERHQFISSRFVKEIALLGGDISSFVPALTLERMLRARAISADASRRRAMIQSTHPDCNPRDRELLMAKTAARRRSPLDPENTLYMDLKDGRVVIALLPDLAPKARRADQGADARGTSTTTRRSTA